MKKVAVVTLTISLMAGSTLFAHGTANTNSSNSNHMGNHMHNGKMTNHANKNGIPDTQVKKMGSNTHTGDHMHNGKMTNHANNNGMTNTQMKKMSN